MSALPFALLAIAVALHGNSASAGEPALREIRKIGVPWSQRSQQWMNYVAFSPDGKEIASDGPGQDGRPHGLTIWKFHDGSFVRDIDASYNGLSRDWHYAIRKHDVVDLRTDKPIYSATDGAWFVFSRDSQFVASSESRFAKGGHGIQVISLPDGRPIASFGTANGQSLAISPDDRVLATGHWDLVMLRDLHTGKQLGVLRGFGRYVTSVSFSPDGHRLVAVTDLGNLQIWDVRTHRRLHIVQLGGGEPSAPAFSPNGRRVAVGMYGAGTAYIIDMATGRLIAHARPSDPGCGSVAFSPDGRYLITPSTGGLITWPYDDGGGTVHVYRTR
jgi:WD40 repeat protein